MCPKYRTQVPIKLNQVAVHEILSKLEELGLSHVAKDLQL